MGNSKIVKTKLLLWFIAFIAPLAVSAPLHFLYDWTGCPFVAIFAPINESVAEHAKIVLYPTLLSSAVMYAVLKRPMSLDGRKFLFGSVVNALTAEYFMVVFFYFSFVGLGIPSTLPFHVMLEVFAVLVGLATGYHAYKNGNPKIGLPIALTLLAVTVLLMTIFTFVPTKIPLYVAP